MPTNNGRMPPGEVPNEGARALVIGLLRQYRARTAIVVTLSILSGLAEGVSVVALLPLLALAGDSATTVPGFADTVENVFRTVGLQPTIGSPQAGLDIAQALPVGELSEEEAEELVTSS